MEQTLGRYRIVGELGRGAMGVVYRAVDPLIGREVAIKTLLADLPEEVLAELRERFLREARSAGRLNHPNIVTIHDVGEHDGVAYIAMELLEGRSLQDMLRDGERLAHSTVAELAAQVADALDHAQRFSIVHRDIKPANIMVDARGRAKLTDFGVAHLADSSMTQTGATLGSPKYMSPEQVLGLAADPRADLFSLGVVLYEMLTGRNPFQQPNDTAFSLMHRIAAEPHVPLRRDDPGIPAVFERIVERSLAKKPEQRYQRAAEMASDLRNYRGVAGSNETRTLPARPAPHAAPGGGQATTVKAAAPQHGQLLTDLENFEANFEREQQARTREEEEARRKELRAKEEQASRWRFPDLNHDPEPAAEPRPIEATESDDRRRAMRDLIKKRGAANTAVDDPAKLRAKAIGALDAAMQEAARYLGEIVEQINSVHPATGRPYDLLHIGRVPSVALSDGEVRSRTTRAEGQTVHDLVRFSYRATPVSPYTVRLHKDDIKNCIRHLKAHRTEHKALAEKRNDFGLPSTALITVTGSLPCELSLRADYDNLLGSVELEGVRRIGRFRAELTAAEFEKGIDELVRYVLGADDTFEARLRRA
jgi:serine/threonine protein kinase